VLYAYNTTTSRKHQRSPFNIIYGRDPKSPLIYKLLEGKTNIPKDPSTRWLSHVRDQADFVKEVVEALDGEARKQGQEYANRSRKEPKGYAPGTLIWVKSFVKQREGDKPKLKKQFRGPYVVLQMTGPVIVQCKPVASTEGADVVHIDCTKPFQSSGGKDVILATYKGALSSGEQDDELEAEEELEPGTPWVVEKVVDYRLEAGTIQFKVRWKGSSADYDEWKTEKDMSCHYLVEEYFRTLGSF
jgi:hypothetical protein